MYIREVRPTNGIITKKYSYLNLVESVRTEKGLRGRNSFSSLGNLPIDRSQHSKHHVPLELKYVCHKQWEELEINKILVQNGVSSGVLPILEALIVGRMIDPARDAKDAFLGE